MLLQQLPTVPIYRVTPASSSQETPQSGQGIWFHSHQEDRLTLIEQRLIEQNDVLNLPVGHAFALVHGGQLIKIRIPLVLLNHRSREPDLANRVRLMQQRFYHSTSKETYVH